MTKQQWKYELNVQGGISSTPPKKSDEIVRTNEFIDILRPMFSFDWELVSKNFKAAEMRAFTDHFEIVKNNKFGKDRIFLSDVSPNTVGNSKLTPGIYLHGSIALLKEIEEITKLKLPLGPKKEEASIILGTYEKSSDHSYNLIGSELCRELTIRLNIILDTSVKSQYTLFIKEENYDRSVGISKINRYAEPWQAIQDLILSDFSQLDPQLNRMQGKPTFVSVMAVGQNMVGNLAEIKLIKPENVQMPSQVYLDFPKGLLYISPILDKQIYTLMNYNKPQLVGEYSPKNDSIIPTAQYKQLQEEVRLQKEEGFRVNLLKRIDADIEKHSRKR